MIQITSVEAVSDFRLMLTFNSGERRCFDMRPYLRYPVFRRLENPAFFALVRVDYGTATWPGEIDIAPETLYERSMPAEDVDTTEPPRAVTSSEGAESMSREGRSS